MRTIHPHAQLGRLATLDTGAGASGQNEAEEETDEIYEAKKGEKNETDENSEVDEETDESQNEGKQVTVDPQNNSNLTIDPMEIFSLGPEKKESKCWSWIPLILQCWPQIRALRIINLDMKNDIKAGTKKKEMMREKGK